MTKNTTNTENSIIKEIISNIDQVGALLNWPQIIAFNDLSEWHISLSELEQTNNRYDAQTYRELTRNCDWSVYVRTDILLIKYNGAYVFINDYPQLNQMPMEILEGHMADLYNAERVKF